MNTAILGDDDALLSEIILGFEAPATNQDASDALSFTESAKVNLVSNKSVSETITFTELALHVDMGAASDTISFTETASAGVNRPATDTLAFIESAKALVTYLRTATDKITFTDKAARVAGTVTVLTSETITFTEVGDTRIKSNLADDTLDFVEVAVGLSNHAYATDALLVTELAVAWATHSVRADDLLVLSDVAVGHRSVNTKAADTITFTDQAFRKLYPVDKSETITFTESAATKISGYRAAQDKLALTETATNTRIYVRSASDQLVFREQKFVPADNVYVGGVLGIKVVDSTTIVSNAGTLSLPRAEFGDAENTTNEFQLRYSMPGTPYTYVRRRRLNRRVVLTFRVSRRKEREILNYFTVANTDQLIVTDWRGQQYRMKLLSNPITSTNVGHDSWRVELEFEGIKITSGGVDLCLC